MTSLKLYASGTTDPRPFYADEDLEIELGSTVESNLAGRFPDIYQATDIPFRLAVEGGDAKPFDTLDPFYFGTTI